MNQTPTPNNPNNTKVKKAIIVNTISLFLLYFVFTFLSNEPNPFAWNMLSKIISIWIIISYAFTLAKLLGVEGIEEPSITISIGNNNKNTTIAKS